MARTISRGAQNSESCVRGRTGSRRRASSLAGELTRVDTGVATSASSGAGAITSTAGRASQSADARGRQDGRHAIVRLGDELVGRAGDDDEARPLGAGLPQPGQQQEPAVRAMEPIGLLVLPLEEAVDGDDAAPLGERLLPHRPRLDALDARVDERAILDGRQPPATRAAGGARRRRRAGSDAAASARRCSAAIGRPPPRRRGRRRGGRESSPSQAWSGWRGRTSIE